MFRDRQRRPSPFADFINWTDYHWEPSTWQCPAGPRPWTGHAASPRRHGFLQVFLAGLAVVAGLKLMSALKASALSNRRNRSWMERGVLALLLLLVASYISKQRRR
jgi:hypothetical protein